MSIALLVITDGRRECLTPTLRSAGRQLDGPVTSRVLIDDSGDLDYAEWLADQAYGFDLCVHGGRSGFDGAIRTAWASLPDDVDHVFHLEDDFTFDRPVDLTAMAEVLDANPHLAQVALRRQPVNDAERAAGGVVEMWPDEYEDRTDGAHHWLEHGLFFTTNPSLYQRSLAARTWPEAPDSERKFTDQLRAEGYRFAFWGRRDEGTWVTHIGDVRVGTGY